MSEDKRSGITDLAESLQIFSKYDNGAYSPTHCEHDVISLYAANPYDVSEEDIKRLQELGWEQDVYPDEDDKLDPEWEAADREDAHFYSFRFGNC